MLCHEVPCMAVRNLSLAILAFRFKLPAHPVDEGTFSLYAKPLLAGELIYELI